MTFDIRDYGAICSDVLQTEKIQAAIDACFKAGGGEVVIPAGIWRTGCIRIRSNVTLHLLSGAIIEGSNDPEDYCGYLNDTVEPLTVKESVDPRITRSCEWFSRWSNGLIKAVHADNIAVIGDKGSFINGMNVYDPQGEENFRGPHPFSFWYCKNVRMSGYTIHNSSNWAHALFYCSDIDVHDVRVYGGHDGFDARCCDRLTISDCEFYTGDDCIAGFDNYDVTVRDCIFNTACFALRFGASKMLVENCRTIGPARYGARWSMDKEHHQKSVVADETAKHTSGWGFVYYCDFRAELRHDPGDITIRNCSFDNLLGLFCLPFEFEYRWCINRSLQSIRFENVTATNVRYPIFINGDANDPLTLEMENVKLTPAEGYETMPVLAAANYKAIRFRNVVCEGYTDPKIFIKTPGEVSVEGGTSLPVQHLGTIDVFYKEN